MGFIESRLIFFIASAPVIIFAFLSIFLKNIVHAIMALIACLLSIAVIYISIHADFIAAAQVAIYVGAISILILFAIMFTRDKKGSQLLHIHRQVGVGVAVGVTMFLTIAFFFLQTATQTTTDPSVAGRLPTGIHPSKLVNPEPSIESISRVMFGKEGESTPYAIPVEMTSIMILAALIGGIEMAKKKEDEV